MLIGIAVVSNKYSCLRISTNEKRKWKNTYCTWTAISCSNVWRWQHCLDFFFVVLFFLFFSFSFNRNKYENGFYSPNRKFNFVCCFCLVFVFFAFLFYLLASTISKRECNCDLVFLQFRIKIIRNCNFWFVCCHIKWLAN